ncbi:MAG: pentapeptide repeat-containing protein [Alphaproteobacteria bacterium]|nr:pentapeptide repeat-containing protein [Alphaproteobacteria bacterium]
MKLDGVSFSGTTMNKCDFTGAHLGDTSGLAKATVFKANFTGATFGRISLVGAHLNTCNFNSAGILGVDFTDAHLSSSIIPQQNLETVKLKGA